MHLSSVGGARSASIPAISTSPAMGLERALEKCANVSTVPKLNLNNTPPGVDGRSDQILKLQLDIAMDNCKAIASQPSYPNQIQDLTDARAMAEMAKQTLDFFRCESGRKQTEYPDILEWVASHP